MIGSHFSEINIASDKPTSNGTTVSVMTPPGATLAGFP